MRTNPRRTSTLLLTPFLTLAMAAYLAAAQPAATEAPETLSDARIAEHLASFDLVWQTIQDRQWDPEFDEQAWADQRDRLRPRVEVATSDAQARMIMNELVGSLGKSHFGIIPRDVYDVLEPDDDEFKADDEDADSDDGDTEDADPDLSDDDEDRESGDTGMTIRLRDDKFLVLRVREGSPADQAGVRPGWIVDRIGDRDTAGILDAARQSAGVQRTDTIAAFAIERWTSGLEGTTAEITFTRPDGEPQTVEFERGPVQGTPTRFANLPEAHLVQSTKTLDNGVGYYALNIFLNPPAVMPEFEKFIRQHIDAPGLVIDMRGNHGGIIFMAMGMGGWFVDEQNVYLGTLHMPGGNDLKLVLNPRDVTYRGPVAVLTDEMSISNAELLAAGLRDIGRARVFGERSAGLLLPSTVVMLPNGDGFQYAIAGYTSASGSSPEGVGVIPEVRVLETPESLSGGADPVLDAALRWIESETP